MGGRGLLPNRQKQKQSLRHRQLCDLPDTVRSASPGSTWHQFLSIIIKLHFYYSLLEKQIEFFLKVLL